MPSEIAGIAAPSLAPAAPQAVASTVAPATSTGFAQLVEHGLEHVQNQLVGGEQALKALAAGEVDNVHQVLIRLEEARLAFQLMLQLRNRALESYQELMRMQV